jgi:hypothetical protein
MPRVIVCDVNETLLDVGALEPRFKELFGDGRVLQEWFTTVLLHSEVATLARPLQRVRNYRWRSARHGRGVSWHLNLHDRSRAHLAGHAVASRASRCAGWSPSYA